MSSLKEQLKMSGLINTFGQPLASGSLDEEMCSRCDGGCQNCSDSCNDSCSPGGSSGC